MGEQNENRKRKINPVVVVVIVILFVLAVYLVTSYLIKASGGGSNGTSSSGGESGRYVGSNTDFEITLSLSSSQNFSLSVKEFASGATHSYSGTYEFMDTDKKIIKFVFSDGSSCRCERTIGRNISGGNFEYISMRNLNHSFPSVWKQ